MTQPIVQALGLTRQVGSGSATLTILDHLDLTVQTGETLAILGASGSGKSTLLGLLAGLDLPTSGSVRLDGEELSALGEDGRAALRGRLLGFVFQSFQLLPALTALENILLPLELAAAKDARARAAAVLEQVGLGERGEHYPSRLSGGEQQRVAIARAFVVEPKLLLADEPTGNLDPVTGARVIELLFGLNREHRSTLILATHDEALAQRCDRRLQLVGGRLEAVA